MPYTWSNRYKLGAATYSSLMTLVGHVLSHAANTFVNGEPDGYGVQFK